MYSTLLYMFLYMLMYMQAVVVLCIIASTVHFREKMASVYGVSPQSKGKWFYLFVLYNTQFVTVF